MKRSHLAVVLATLLAAGASCSRPVPDLPSANSTATSSPSPSAVVHPRPMAPLHIEATGPQTAAPGSTIDVQLRIERRVPSAVPMVVRVTLPAGAELVKGMRVENILDPVSPIVERSFQVSMGAVPVDDIVFELDQGGPSMTTHARAAYRFGRAAPRLPEPQVGPTIDPTGPMPIVPIRMN
jgi:hypothetical protein